MKLEEATKSKIKKIYSEEERRQYCEAYAHSGMTQVEFCKANGISKSALLKWRNELSKIGISDFYQASLSGSKSHLGQHDELEIRIRLSNQIELCMVLREASLVSLIEGLSHATTVIR